jgi:ABC-type multidrug transport system fused ATPase/permease subunit
VATLCLYALDLPRDLPKLLGVLLGGSLIKSLLGIYFMYFIAFPRGEFPPHTTGHNDTMILVTASVTALTLFWEKASRRHFWLLMAWAPFLALALKLNDRRIAYVDIVMALGLIYLMSPMHEMKRKLTRAAVLIIPVLLVYGAAGWNTRSGRFFAPVQKVRSIVAPPEDTEEESSNVERDIENFNLMKSWERNMVFGQGFGHAFTEFVPSNDFGQSAFGHIGHNSILWLLWIGGIVGFTGVLAYLAVGVFLAGRALRLATAWRERVALLVSLSIIITYLMQAFGDMGTQAMMFDFFVGAALAIAGRLATKAGAWRPIPVEEPVSSAHEPDAITV